MSLKLKKTSRHLLSTAEAAELLGMTPRFLALDRHQARANGTSPTVPYVRLGHRTVRYRKADIEALIERSVVE